MNTKKCLLFIVSFLIIVISLSAQKSLKQGYYLKPTGDTISCKINFRDSDKNPDHIEVVLDNGNKVTLGLQDAAGFGVYGYADYLKGKVSYHTAHNTGSDLPEQFSDNVQSQEVFLKIIKNGRYHLYEAKLLGQYYYFISTDGKQFDELLYRVKQKDMVISEDKSYQNYLRGLLEKEGMLDQRMTNMVNSAMYNSNDIGKLVDHLNKTKKTESNKSSNHQKPFSFEVFAGPALNLFPTGFTGVYDGGNHFKSALSATGGVNVNYRFASNYQRTSIGISVSVNNFQSSSTRNDSIVHFFSQNSNNKRIYSEDFSMKFTMLNLNLSVSYILNPQSPIKSYVRVGLNNGLVLSGGVTSKYTSAYYIVANGNPPIVTNESGTKNLFGGTKTILSLSIATGVTVKRSRVEVSWVMPSDIYVADPGTASLKVGMVGLLYYLTLSK